MREVLRRMILVAGVAAALCMVRWQPLGSLVWVEPVDMRQAFAEGERFYIIKRETMAHLKTLSPEAYVERLTKDRAFQAQGTAWERFFQRVNQFYKNPDDVPDWKWRATGYRYGGRPFDLFFKPTAPPLAELSELSGLLRREDTIFVRLGQKGAPANAVNAVDIVDARWIKVRRVDYDAEDYRPFFGFSGRDAPVEFLQPLLVWCWVPLALAWLCYARIPWPKREPAEVYHPAWGLAFMDAFLVMVMIVLFFGLPFALGGPVQTFSQWWGIALVLWPMAFLCMWGLRYSAWYAGFGLRIRPEGLLLTAWGRSEEIDFSQIASLTRAELHPSKWLSGLLMAGSLAGGAGTVGQALIYGSSRYRGFIFRLTDGREFVLWFTNQLGNPVLRNVEGTLQTLIDAKVPLNEKIEVRYGLGGMSDRFLSPSDTRGWLEKHKQSLMIMATPVVVVLLAWGLSGLPFLGGWNAESAPGNMARTGVRVSAPRAPAAQPAGPPASPAAWSTLIGPPDGGAQFRFLTMLPDGSLLAVGDFDDNEVNMNAFAAAISPDGRTLWRANLSGGYHEEILRKVQDFGWEYGIAALPTGAGPMVLVESQLQNRSDGEALLIALDAAGEERWRLALGRESVMNAPLGLAADGQGSAVVLLYGEPGMWSKPGTLPELRLVAVDAAGNKNWEKVLDVDLAGVLPKAFAAAPRGGYALAGTFNNQGPGHLDGLLVLLDAKGAVAWRRQYGGSNPESVRGVLPLADGGFVLVGATGLAAEGGLRPLVIRTDARGGELWRRALAAPRNSRALQAVELPGAGLAILYEELQKNGSSGRACVAVLRKDGEAAGELWLRPDETAEAMAALPDGGLALAGGRTQSNPYDHSPPPSRALLTKFSLP